MTLAGSLLIATPAGAESRDTRVARTCGDFCIQGEYSDASVGAWFIDGTNTAVLVDYESFRVINTFTQRTVKTVDAPIGEGIDAFALSSDKSFAAVAFSSGQVFVYDTDNWVEDNLTGSTNRGDVRALAVSDDGGDAYLGRYTTYGVPGSIERWSLGGFEETTPVVDNYGISVMKLSNDDAKLYVGYNGAAPTLQSFDATDISAGPTASDNSERVWAIDSIEITSTGRVFASNNANRLSDSVSGEPRILEYNPTTLAELDSYITESEWQRWEIGLSADESSIFGLGEFVSQGSPEQPNRIIEVDDDSLDALDGIIELPGTSSFATSSVDVDPTGKYLLATTDEAAYIISLDADSPVPSLDYNYGTRVVSWDYIFLKAKAQFKWFEVKYRKPGSSKWTVKRVKRSTEKYLNDFRGGTDAVQVRAVYTKAKHNSRWGTVDVAP